MSLTNLGGPDDPAASVILTVQREKLAKFGIQLLDQQRAVMERIQADMDRTVVELGDALSGWRRRLIFTIQATTLLLVPWLAALGLLIGATVFLGVKTREAWGEYRVAADAAERLRVQGALTVIKDGELYVRIDRANVFKGPRGNWYARAPRLQFTGDEITTAELR